MPNVEEDVLKDDALDEGDGIAIAVAIVPLPNVKSNNMEDL